MGNLLDRRRWCGAVVIASGGLLLPHWAVAQSAAKRAQKKPEPTTTRRRYRRYDREPRLLLFTSVDAESSRHDLTQLERPGGPFEQLYERGWMIGETANQHIQVLYAENRPDWVRRFQIVSLPWIGCLERGAIVRTYDLATMRLDARTLVWLLTGESEPELDVAGNVQTGADGHYPGRGGHWSVYDDDHPIRLRVIEHLRNSPHNRYFPAEWVLEEWSIAELRGLHDDLHIYRRPRELMTS